MADYSITLAMGGTGVASVNNATSSNRIQITAGQSFTVQISSGITASGSKGVGGANVAPYYGSGYFVNQGTPSGVYTRTYSALSATLVGNDYRLRWVGYLDGSIYGSLANENYQNGVMYITVAESEANQSHPTVTGVSYATTASNQTVATISTSGGTGTLQTAVSTSSTAPTSGWTNGNTQNVIRGTAYYIWARSSEYSQSNVNYNTPLQSTPPYLLPDTSVTVANLTSSTGTWTATVANVSGNYNTYYLYTQGYGSPIYNNTGGHINTGLGGYSLVNNLASNTPAGATTYYGVTASRSVASGGDGQQDGTTAVFNVTRSIDAVCHDTSGNWFDATSSAVDPSNTDNALRTRASFSSMNTSRRYVIARQNSSGAYEVARSWWQGVSSQTSYTFTDPLAALNTQRTYKLYSNTSDTLSGATDELNFTRTRKTHEVTEPGGASVAVGASSYTITLADTIAGFTYYIKDGNGTGATTGGSATATGTSTDITVSHSSCLPGVAGGSNTTVHVWALSPLNWYSTTSYATGDSFLVTRTGGSGTGGSGTGGTSTEGDYGIIVRDASNNLLVDTTSRFGRIVGSSNSSGVLTGSGSSWVTYGNWSEWRQLDGITNDTSTWHVVVEVESSDGVVAYGHNFHEVELSSDNGGQFRIKNKASPTTKTHKYHYIVVRTR